MEFPLRSCNWYVRNERNVSATKCYARDATRDQTLLIRCIKVAQKEIDLHITKCNIARVIYRSVDLSALQRAFAIVFPA